QPFQAALRYGPYRSSDGGAAWASLTNGLNFHLPYPSPPAGPGGVSAIVAAPSNAGDSSSPFIVYAGAGLGRGGLFRSESGGEGWTRVYPHPSDPPESVGSVRDVAALAIAPNDPSTVYVSIDEHFSHYTIRKTTDTGGSWSETGTLPTGYRPDY